MPTAVLSSLIENGFALKTNTGQRRWIPSWMPICFGNTTSDFAQNGWINELANVALLHRGLLGCSPLYPEVAYSLDLLEFYHRLRRRHPRLGIQPFVQAVCDIHDVNYTGTQRRQFSAAFDAYLAILRRVNARCEVALRRNEEHWRMRNSCPPCTLQLQDEPPMKPERLFAMDGNNSAKRVATAGREDPRSFKSDYFLPRHVVDRFKDEVKRKSQTRSKTSSSADDNASAAEHEKRALNIYKTTGIFVCACRHGFVQKACEMVRSGELAKYPLVHVDHVIDVHGQDTGCGYDIGCSFKETVNKSPLLHMKALAAAIQFVVCAFHGYAHNRLCQLANHPLYLTGYGIEDLEGMERLFSASNNVARVIRYASPFHWMQSLDLHFTQWDEDKYSELSNFLLNNYKQSLRIIAENTVEVEQLKAELKIDDSAFKTWLEEEKTFLSALREPPEEQVLETAYVQALITCQQAQDKLERVRHEWVVVSNNDDLDYGADARRTRRIEAARRSAFDELALAIQAVGDLEAKLEIDQPWTPAHPRYQETLSRIRHREFHCTLDKVQQLVMQRLFELSKANMSGMAHHGASAGYKMRTSIWKGLKVRAKALRTALKKYNKLAAEMQPPAPELHWKDVVNYTFVSEFDLLRSTYAHRDILKSPWTIPRNREVAAKYFKLLSAQDEIPRLNREIRRLDTSIKLERREYARAIKDTTPDNPLLAAELCAQYQTRRRFHQIHTARIATIRSLPGYSGSLERGKPLQRGPLDELGGHSAGGMASVDADAVDDVFNDEVDNLDLVRLAKFLERTT
ncbi:hypothetical protein PYCCODRAFT_1441222 [Trametes coccinea BRFM310]|uniref:Uncharacterized protein n=1 Tax=Trametes coccinea (strain BRFM310) TaxID=1353009 RepID=A0A1Y2J4D8_TRAC3|nr:hypothetical protein PYCCODRAFT_1441222 [Trametes coccinea BRFM310]